ncbi:hypothetical protein CO614_10915 [Lysobacteraceae bacterium NML120232]|nr:hypothetical protein CO614_10915 [Xanthomonadaceae bacterium NML120232]
MSHISPSLSLLSLAVGLAFMPSAQALSLAKQNTLDCAALGQFDASVDSIVVSGSRLREMGGAIAKVAAIAANENAIPASSPPPAPPAPHLLLVKPSHGQPVTRPPGRFQPMVNTERYGHYDDNPVKRARENPLSTFSVDVDTGSYTNVRRMLNQNLRPPADAVRAEEFINYFDYGLAKPHRQNEPLRVETELAQSPWNSQRQLLRIAMTGYTPAQIPAANLVFLVDTSGSMASSDKLPLVRQAICQMLPQLRAEDRISIVTYAGDAGLHLPPTPGNQSHTIYQALKTLGASGSTHGSAGIQMAYEQARKSFIRGGVNRVLLATDGDFNVGTVNQNALETLVADQRKHGIALTTLGVGRGNYNEHLAERLADVGDGNYSYLDSLAEAHRVLVKNMRSTLLTIAQDVKLQVEFNPAQVAEYRLIGYENRTLRDEDFQNDRVDAGDVGAGHQVTALYEITRTGSAGTQLPTLRYQKQPSSNGDGQGEIATVSLRYKLPGHSQSQLRQVRIENRVQRASPAMNLAASAAAFADALRGGQRIGMPLADIARLARQGGSDSDGQRGEFVQLIGKAERLIDGD